jgi:hypothetical protein
MTDLPMATDAPQPKTIFEPVDIPHLLQGWLVHAHKGRQRHDWAARRCDTHRRRIGGSAAVFSAIVGTSVFAVLEKAELDIMLKIGVAAIAIVAAILTNLITFLNLAEQAEKHRSAGVRYKIMIRELEYILCAPDNKPTNADAPGVKKQLDNLEETAPVVPEWLYAKVEEEWKKKGVHFVDKAICLYPYPGTAGQCPSKPEP